MYIFNIYASVYVYIEAHFHNYGTIYKSITKFLQFRVGAHGPKCPHSNPSLHTILEQRDKEIIE